MKRYIIFAALFFLFVYPTLSTAQQEKPLPSSQTSEIPVQTEKEALFSTKKMLKPLYGKLLTDVSISKSSFNPGNGEEVLFRYSLSQPARVTIHVYDSDWELIRTLAQEKSVSSGEQTITWDGKDRDGTVVPDEAYFLLF